jgi:1-acyl-sn-glycerol-3-phosphate acyltransferase
VTIPPFHWWRTVFYLIPLISVYTIALGSLSLLSSFVDARGIAAHGCARLWSWLILATTGVRTTVVGLDRLEPDGTYVFVSNHQSIYDIPILFNALPFQLRIIAKASLGRIPFMGWHLRRTGHVLVDRANPQPAAILRRWRTLVGQRLSLIVFPEGTRSVDGRLGAFKGGSFLMAIEAGLPIVPVAVIGSRHVMRKGRLRTEPGEVTVVVHAPVETSGLAAADARGLGARVRDVIAMTLEHQANSSVPAPDPGTLFAAK